MAPRHTQNTHNYVDDANEKQVRVKAARLLKLILVAVRHDTTESLIEKEQKRQRN